MCVKNHIHIEPKWIPREQNELADYYSRLVDFDDYRLNSAIFRWLNSLWGHTVLTDLLILQIKWFNSRFWTPGSEAIDAFTCNWEGENNWWFPPVSLVPRVITHAQKHKSFWYPYNSPVALSSVLATSVP